MWQPLNETYFVKMDEITCSDLIPEQFKKSMVELRTGIIVNVGTGVLLESGLRAPMQAKVGERVMFGSKTGAEIEVDGEKLLLLAEANVLAVQRAEQIWTN